MGKPSIWAHHQDFHFLRFGWFGNIGGKPSIGITSELPIMSTRWGKYKEIYPGQQNVIALDGRNKNLDKILAIHKL